MADGGPGTAAWINGETVPDGGSWINGEIMPDRGSWINGETIMILSSLSPPLLYPQASRNPKKSARGHKTSLDERDSPLVVSLHSSLLTQTYQEGSSCSFLTMK